MLYVIQWEPEVAHGGVGEFTMFYKHLIDFIFGLTVKKPWY